jgi:hypothetical protein
VATWRDWTSRLEWDGDVEPAIKDRLASFLNRAMDKIAALAAGLDGGTDLDIVAALSGELRPLGAALASEAEDTAQAIHEWAIETADRTEVRTWQRAIAGMLEAESTAVQFVSVAVLLERICHAVVAGCPELDTEGVLAAAADRLEQHTRAVLAGVQAGRISPSTYRTM